jgi:hypothetical protein
VEVVAPPATSVPASGFPSNSANPSGEAAAAIRAGRGRRRVLELDELEERDAADAKADGAGREVMPTEEASAGDKGSGDGNKRF